ncbi:ADAM 12 protein [Couchioplanes caeruleus subsp. caeruleus]|uniref:ADAM 12 protein n=1 Tax=Couchioplanes caeruleus subsp. caeruleus TaxID=56427 RepID=A0A1K0F948_9ACTN|nr:ADAM 12 protein [Couchioplanes caeruleus subsp. caeruleus]
MTVLSSEEFTVKPPKSAAPGRLLTQVAGERRTGALIVGGTPGGTVHLDEGLVTYAESAAAPGVGELLTASGRLAARTWQAALDAGTPRASVGRLLLDQGHITQGELELCVLGATYDAAYFALSPASAPVDFVDGVKHWLGDLVRVDPAALNRESRRRVRLLDEIFPYPQLDTEAVIPVTRPPRERITLTAAQWELLVHADGQRTPADLAQLLGRAGYATIQELRRLAAAGLIELPTPRDAASAPTFVRLPRARGTAVDVHRATPPGPAVPAVTATRPGLASGDPPVREPDPATANGSAYRPPRLARRKPGAKLPKELAAEPAPIHPGTDEVLLKRIRTALKALR